MTALERDILKTLTELEEGVAVMKTAEAKPNLVPLFTQLSEFSTQLSKTTHAQLIHYLTNGSYEKAKLWLLGRDAENARGVCGR